LSLERSGREDPRGAFGRAMQVDSGQRSWLMVDSA